MGAFSFSKAWHGHWIWIEDASLAAGSPIAPDRREREPSMALFRTSATLDRVPAAVPVRLTADSRYRLYVNDILVGRGPVRAQPRRLTYDRYDLAPFLKPGVNTIAVEVLYYGRSNSLWMPAVGNATLGRSGVLVFEAFVDGKPWCVSDENWSACLCKGFMNDAHDPQANMVGGGVPAESHDARNRSARWTSPDFDDSDWARARPILPIHMGGPGRSRPPADPYGPLTGHALPAFHERRLGPVGIRAEQVSGTVRRDLAPPAARIEKSCLEENCLVSRTAILPATMAGKAGHHNRLVLDFGEIVAGYVRFELEAEAGLEIDIAYLEEPITAPAHFGAHGGTRYTARGQADAFETFGRQGFRYAILVSDGPFTLTGFEVVESLYPWSGDYTFSSDMPLHNALYCASKRTVALNSWDCFIDCPSREQRAWAGDSVVHLMTHLVANGDWALCWRHLELTASPRPDGILPMSVGGDVEFGEGFTIPDWSLHWLHGLYLLFLHSGDKARLQALMPVAEGILRWFLPYRNDDGLLEDVAEWCLVDWSSVHTRGLNAPVNGLWARGLREFAALSDWLGDGGRAAWARNLYQELHSGFEIFWDETRGLYVDQVRNGQRFAAANQISTALAIVAGLCPAGRLGRAGKALQRNLVYRSWLFGPEEPHERGHRFRSIVTSSYQPDWDIENEIVSAEPFMSYVVHDAMAMADPEGHALLDSLQRWKAHLEGGYRSFRERWGGGSHAHGWSSTPARDLVWNVLGLTPAEPGYAKASLRPQPGTLKMIRASIPTPHGAIEVEIDGGLVSLVSPVPIEIHRQNGLPVTIPAGKYNNIGL
ncbi:family 78 glycoside hydrolase catalytic domain [Allorhizobium undicola]|uniref:family 78 glycoside hydrolase catalytic domain n=1 Tax=Allorhizobium undicola TaxID=78527 RepID=UPI0012B66CEF|nr:family 78 glycoside hydrolase catalytic domain [Allorhizobium undicola]